MILSVKKSVILFPFICLIFIQHPSNATPVTLSKQNNGTQLSADAEFHTIRYNLSLNVRSFLRWGNCYIETIPKNLSPTTKNETGKLIVEFCKGEYLTDGKVSFKLVDDGKSGRAIAKIEATILDDFGREVRSRKELHELGAGKDAIVWYYFLKETDVTENPHIKKNTVTISFEISYYYLRCSNLTDQQNITSPEPNTTKCLVTDNFSSLLGNEDFADVMLLAKGKNYSAHKAVLAARSEVFATTFKNIEQDDKKHRKIRIDISDKDVDVMDEVLRYIYTGKCQTSANLAERLYAAADAYKLNELKTIALKSMVETLSVKSAVNVLVFADKHHMKELKSEVIDFIVENSVQVLNTTEWKSMVMPNAHLANEIFQVFSQRLCKALPCESFLKLVLAEKLK
ncbi:speckle-type POZ protein B-like [Planococcus citri]|uniref:speckle-type POZ protein B-like n=1 Tax=Planococcus citri TaxID=170843 RepID=UPI0031F93978